MKTSLQSSNAQQLRIETLRSAVRPSPVRSTGWIVLPLVFGMAALVANPAHAVDHTWSNPGNDNFNVAANWNPATVPVAADNTFVDNGGEVLINDPRSVAQCNAGTMGTGTYTQSASTFAAAGFRFGSANGAIGTFNSNGGAVNTPTTGSPLIYLGDVVGGTGNLNIGGGTFNVPSTTPGNGLRIGNAGTGNVNISSGLLANNGATASMGFAATGVGNMTISGTGNYTGAATMNVGNLGTGTLNLQPGGTLTNGTVVLGSGAGRPA